MSTDLYGIRVLERDGASLVLQVFIVYSDIEDLPSPGKPFFLRVLCDQARPPSPLGELLEAERRAGHKRDDAWIWAHAEELIAEVEQLDTTYPGVIDFSEPGGLPPAAQPERDQRGKKGRWKDRDRPPLWFHHHDPTRNGGLGGWAHEEQLPHGTYFVGVTDPRWAEHLRQGQSWGTAAYED